MEQRVQLIRLLHVVFTLFEGERRRQDLVYIPARCASHFQDIPAASHARIWVQNKRGFALSRQSAAGNGFCSPSQLRVVAAAPLTGRHGKQRRSMPRLRASQWRARGRGVATTCVRQ